MRHRKAVTTESRKISFHLSKDRIVVIILDFLLALAIGVKEKFKKYLTGVFVSVIISLLERNNLYKFLYGKITQIFKDSKRRAAI